MKKKIGDLTLNELKTICIKSKKCDNCPLEKYNYKNVYDCVFALELDEELEKEIEVDNYYERNDL